jgi:hypothetical protein
MNHSKQQFTKQNTLGEQCNHLAIESRNVVWLTAGQRLLVFTTSLSTHEPQAKGLTRGLS